MGSPELQALLKLQCFLFAAHAAAVSVAVAVALLM